MNQSNHIAFKVSSYSFDWILFTCRYPFFMNNISSVKFCFIYINCIVPIYKTGLFRPFFSGFHMSFWKFESQSWSRIRISHIFKFLVIEESNKTILWLLSYSFWMSFELNISFWLKICLIASSIICVLEPSLTLEIFLLFVPFPGFYCSDCK